MSEERSHYSEVTAAWQLLEKWRHDPERNNWDTLMLQKRTLDELLVTSPALFSYQESVHNGKHLMAELVYAEFEGKQRFAVELEKEDLTNNSLGKWIYANSSLSGASKKIALHLAKKFSQEFNLKKVKSADTVSISRSELMKETGVSQITLARANRALAESEEWEVTPGLGSRFSSYRPLFIIAVLRMKGGMGNG